MSEELHVLAAAAATVSAAGIWRTVKHARAQVAQWHDTLDRKTGELRVPHAVHTDTGRQALTTEA